LKKLGISTEDNETSYFSRLLLPQNHPFITMEEESPRYLDLPNSTSEASRIVTFSLLDLFATNEMLHATEYIGPVR
jgi:hypothetical protein